EKPLENVVGGRTGATRDGRQFGGFHLNQCRPFRVRRRLVPRVHLRSPLFVPGLPATSPTTGNTCDSGQSTAHLVARVHLADRSNAPATFAGSSPFGRWAASSVVVGTLVSPRHSPIREEGRAVTFTTRNTFGFAAGKNEKGFIRPDS